jgi:hypothetical protein
MIKEEIVAEPALLSFQTERFKSDVQRAKSEISQRLGGFVAQFEIILNQVKNLEAENSKFKTGFFSFFFFL